MKRLAKIPGTAVIILALLHVPFGYTQIYKWVDEDGKVHYGDKPMNMRDAAGAEKVEVREAYKPAAKPSAAETTIQQREDALKKSQAIRHEETRQREEAEKLAAREKKKKRETHCANLEREYHKFSGVHVVDGRQTFYYLEDENGQSVSEAEQRRYVESLVERGKAAGCEPFTNGE